VFEPPSECNYLPISDDENPTSTSPSQGISFPTAYTMTLHIVADEFTLYYDGDNQMWRLDYLYSTTIQKGGIQYQYNNAGSNPPYDITPLPCVQEMQNFTFPNFGFPTSFPYSYGNATLVETGQLVDIWGAPGVISYWLKTTPLIFLGNNFSPVHVTNFQEGTPASNLFQPPSLCVSKQ